MRFMRDRSVEHTEELENKYGIVGSASSRLGSRKSQQDAFSLNAADPGCVLAVLCDGMGGMEGGELASQTTVQAFVRDFEKVRNKEDNFYHFLREEVDVADRLVHSLRDARGKKMDSGTTLVASIIVDGYFQYMAVGDSRIYLIRDGILYQITRDHNYLLYLEYQRQKDLVSEEAYEIEKSRGQALISYIGMDGVAIADGNQRPFLLEENDILLMCSDGLCKALSDQDILRIVKENNTSVGQMNYALQEAADQTEPDSQDNTTIIVLRYQKI